MAKIDEQISYNWLFFLLAGAFGVVTFWAVYDEDWTRREYKRYQESFFEIEAKLAQKAYEDAKTKLEASPKYQALTVEHKKLDDELRGPKAASYKAAQEKLQEAEFVAYDKTQDFTFAKSLLDEEYYSYTLAKHELGNEATPDSPEYKNLQKHTEKYQELQKKLDAAERVASAANADRDKVKAEVASYTDRLKAIEKELEDLNRPMAELKRKYEASEGKKSGLFGPATEITQQNVEELGRVDRCESCHAGANRGGFEKVTPGYFRSHPYRRTLFSIHPVEKFGCTTCHDGQGRATTKFYAHASIDNPHDAEKHFWEFPLLKGSMMESECRQCHRSEYDLRANLKCETDDECPTDAPKCGPLAGPLNPATNLSASIDAKIEEARYCGTPNGGDADKVDAVLVDLAPHLSRGRKIIEEAACYGCHPIEGYEGKPKAGPDLRHAVSKLNTGWMVDWIVNPKAFRPKTRMPNFFPERLHIEEYPDTAKPRYTDMSTELGKVGDTDKEKRQRALDLLSPEHFQPEQQAALMASFLLANSSPLENLPATAPAGDAKNGEKLVDSLGCYGCHSITRPGEQVEVKTRNRATHYDHGPDLGNIGAKTNPAWLFAWIKDPKAYAPGTRMPSLRLSDQEAADIATFLAGNKYVNGAAKEYGANPAVDVNNADSVYLGKKLVNFYGCYGCHMVKGFEQTAGVGAELTEFGIKDTARLDYGDYIVKHSAQTWDAWIDNKLQHPRVYRYERVDTKMPQFDFNREEIDDVKVVLKGMRGRTRDGDVRSHQLSSMEQAREKGRELVRFYNCYGCHTVDGHTGDIRQLAAFQGTDANGAEKGRLAPPVLAGEGGKTQPPWLFGFLKAPSTLRPSLTVRMPTFSFSDEESTTLVQMFSAFDGAEFPYHDYSNIKLDGPRRAMAQSAFTAGQCLRCHSVTDKITPDQAAIGAPNLLLTKKRLRGEWLLRWLHDPQVLAPGVNMPSFFAAGNPLVAADKSPQTANLPGIADVAKLDGDGVVTLLRDFLMNLDSPAEPAKTTAAK